VTTTVRYFDATTERTVERTVGTDADVRQALDAAAATRTDRGVPAVEVSRDDGSTLTLATDGERAALIWVDYLGQSFHSSGGEPGAALVYDYFGSWSEVPSECALSAAAASAALIAFAGGRNEIGVTFELD
jgi:hypothetical protein